MELLTEAEVRIIGSLIEKELTTPEYYPLTVNSLMNACNQKSNRYPVVNYDEELIERNIENLRLKKMVTRVTGDNIRVPKFRQIFTEELKLLRDEIAVLTVLMLRGPQTAGEIKGRTGRMYEFESLTNVSEVLNRLIKKETPLIKILSRKAGMKEPRYTQLFSGCVTESVPDNKEEEEKVENKIPKIEEEIKLLRDDISELKNQFEKFKKQFE